MGSKEERCDVILANVATGNVWEEFREKNEILNLWKATNTIGLNRICRNRR